MSDSTRVHSSSAEQNDPRDRADAAAAKDDGWLTVRSQGDGLHHEIVARGHRLSADEPASIPGGTDRGPTPYELLLGALGACTAMTVRMYANRKKWPLDSVSVRLRHGRIHAEDCGDCETTEGQIDEIALELAVTGDLDEDQRSRLLQIANRCPVKRTLSTETKVRSALVRPQS